MRGQIQRYPAVIAIIIVNYNSGTLLSHCLESLSSQTWKGFRTIVVDNGSTDGSTDGIAPRFPGIKVLLPGRNLGFAAGNNLALEETQDCDWVVLLNPDAFPVADWLERLVAAADLHPEFDFFGCLMRAADAQGLLDGTGDVYHVSGLSWRRDHGVAAECGTGQGGEIFGPCAAAAMYHRPALMEVGGFDETYFCYHEDVDLAFRLRLRGHRCWYEPSAVVDHVGSGISGKNSDFSTYHGHRNLVWTFFKDMPTALLLCYLPWHIVANLMGIIVCAHRGQLRIALKAKFDALRATGHIMRERRRIQRSRTVGSLYLLSVMTRGIRPLLRRAAQRPGCRGK